MLRRHSSEYENSGSLRNRWALLLCGVLALGLFGCGDDSGNGMPEAGPMEASMPDATPPDAMVPDAAPRECGDTVGNFCTSNLDCVDPCFCNGAEVCLGGRCVLGTPSCDDGVECTVDECDEEEQTCGNTADDTVCDDMNSCTGIEICDLSAGCLPGIPMNCSDADSCTLDSCDPVMGCLHVLRDLDGDGYASLSCEGGRDCNDDPVTGAMINPDAVEICDDGIDNNCDGIADYFDTATCVPTNDTCASPRVLDSSGSYPFSTNGLSDDYNLSCESSGVHPDAVFQFTTTAVRDVAIEIAGSPFNASLELRTLADCDPSAMMAGDAIACDRDTSSFGSDTARIERSNLEPGTYVIIASMPSEGFYSLDLRITSPVPPPREDLCDFTSTPVISASGTFSSAFATLSDDYPNLPCRDRTEPQPEAAYRLSLTRPSDVRLVARGYSDTGFQRDIAMAVVRDCGNPATTSVACDTDNFTSDPAEINFTSMPAGDYWVLIEIDEYTFYTVEGYELTASISVPPPPVPGDACGMPLDITTSMQMVDVSALRNDGGLGCGGTGLAYRDAVFRIDVAAESSVTFNTSGGFHLLSLSSDCTDSSTEVACTASSPAGAGTITQTLAAGTYYLKVSIPDTTGTLTASATITAL